MSKRTIVIVIFVSALVLLLVLFFPCKMCLDEGAFECKLYQSTKRTLVDARSDYERGTARKTEIAAGLFELNDYVDGWGNKIRCSASGASGIDAAILSCYSLGSNRDDPDGRIYDMKDSSAQYCKK